MLKLAGMIHAGLTALVSGLLLASSSPAAPLPPSPAALPAVGDLSWSEGRDRLMSGVLDPDVDALSQANALYADALDHEAKGQHTIALEELRRVAALDPHFAEAQIKLARLLLQSGQMGNARNQLCLALSAQPDSAPIQAMLGCLSHLQGNEGEARRLCLEALTEDPGQMTAMRVLLEIFRDEDGLETGVAKITALLASHTAEASTWLDLARLYRELARNDSHPPVADLVLKTLLPVYAEAAGRQPANLESLTLLADTYQQLGRKREALETLLQASALDPSNVDFLLGCAELEMELGQRTAALGHYEKAYAFNPALTGLHAVLARLYAENHQYRRALPFLREAMIEAPDDASLGIALGIAYEGLQREEEAQACFQKVFAASSCPPEAYLKLSLFQLDQNKIREAGRTLATAHKRFPQLAEIRFYQAVQYRCAKNYRAALRALAEVRALATDSENEIFDVNYYLESALILDEAGQKKDIEPTLREGLTRYPDDSNLMNELAYVWADQGVHLADALAYSRRAAELDPENGPIQDTCGWVYFRMGQPKEALPYLQRAAIMTNNDPVVLQHVGDAYLTTGHRREAIATWRRAMEKDPENHELAHRIDAALAQANHAHLRSAPLK